MIEKKLLIKCDECGEHYEMLEKTIKKRFEKYGMNLCLSCGQKGQRNQIYNKGLIPVNILRKTITIVCDECHEEFQISQGKCDERFKKYGMNLCRSCSRKGERNPFYDKRFSEKQKETFSNIRKGYYNDKDYGQERRTQQSERYLGENNPLYRENIEKVSRSPTIRIMTLKAYNYTCAKCHEKKDEVELDAHHLNSMDKNPKQRFDLENVVCICVKCHRIFHRLYGNGKNTKAQFESFLTESSETIESAANKKKI